MKKLVYLFSIGFVFILSSCSKAPVIEDPTSIVNPTTTTTTTDNSTTNLDELEVSSTFNWKTYRDVSISLTGSNNSIVEVISQDGNTVYQKAYLSKDNAYEIKLAIPTYEKQLKLKYKGQVKSVDISSGNVNYTFV